MKRPLVLFAAIGIALSAALPAQAHDRFSGIAQDRHGYRNEAPRVTVVYSSPYGYYAPGYRQHVREPVRRGWCPPAARYRDGHPGRGHHRGHDRQYERGYERHHWR